ncbi:hypothetical protein Ancab_016302 [Ancistrocladus abbreviatus]
MVSRQRGWSVFDGVRFLPATPDAFMAEINAAIATLEYVHASAMLNPSPSTPSNNKTFNGNAPVYDASIAEEAYRLACLALAEGKVDEALHSLNVSLSKCPPEKTDTIDKIRSLISHTTQQLLMYSR